MNPQTPLFVHGVFLPGLDDLVHQLGDAQHILVGFRGQTQHKVELYVVPASGKGLGAGIQNFVFGQILVDHVPKPLGARLRSKGQTAFPDGLQLFH